MIIVFAFDNEGSSLEENKVIVKESLVELRVDMHFLYVHSQPEGKYIDCIKFSTFHF